jgi:hypothetical protein
MVGNISWLLPVWLQMMFPGLVFVFALFLPESPRWLYTNGQMDKAKSFLTKYHGNGNPDSEWVKLQMWEYETYLELQGADKRWWDYRALFKNRASVYRLMTNCLTSLFGQWAGNGTLLNQTPVITFNNMLIQMYLYRCRLLLPQWCPHHRRYHKHDHSEQSLCCDERCPDRHFLSRKLLRRQTWSPSHAHLGKLRLCRMLGRRRRHGGRSGAYRLQSFQRCLRCLHIHIPSRLLLRLDPVASTLPC